LEVHLAPVGDVARVQVRRLNELSGELATVGRASGFFSASEGLNIDSDADAAWVMTDGHRTGPAGFAVQRLGQRSAWLALPTDDLAAVLDEKDAVDSLTRMLCMLTSLARLLAAFRQPQY
jgi:hypothetical protein